MEDGEQALDAVTLRDRSLRRTADRILRFERNKMVSGRVESRAGLMIRDTTRARALVMDSRAGVLG